MTSNVVKILKETSINALRTQLSRSNLQLQPSQTRVSNLKWFARWASSTSGDYLGINEHLWRKEAFFTFLGAIQLAAFELALDKHRKSDRDYNENKS